MISLSLLTTAGAEEGEGDRGGDTGLGGEGTSVMTGKDRGGNNTNNTRDSNPNTTYTTNTNLDIFIVTYYGRSRKR